MSRKLIWSQGVSSCFQNLQVTEKNIYVEGSEGKILPEDGEDYFYAV